MKFLPETSDLLNDNGLDEMQKTYAYRLAFKCFKALYWSNNVFCFILMFFSAVTNISGFYAITSLMLFTVTNIIYLIFGAKASGVGAISPSFAKNMAKPATIIAYVAIFVIYTTVAVLKYNETGNNFFIYYGIFLAILIVSHIALGYIAKKNNKVTEETEED